MPKDKRKKNRQNKSKNPPNTDSTKPQDSSFLTIIALTAVVLIIAIFFQAKFNDTAFQESAKETVERILKNNERETETQEVYEQEESKTVDITHPPLTMEEITEMKGLLQARTLKKNCFENGKCIKLRPWKSNREYFPPEGCTDKRDTCAAWAKRGQCDTNPGWMIVYCPVACKACHLLKSKKRCRRDPEQMPVLVPGDIKATFLSLPERFPHLEPEVLQTGDDELYFAVFKNFLSDHEADTLISWLERLNPKRSKTQTNSWDSEGGVMEQAHNSVRTSENAWCTGACWQDETVMGVIKRISEVTHVPPVNFENFQLVRYTKGQFYRTHNDCNPKDNVDTQTAGHRIFTIFLYLNDVEEGGATDFPTLGERVQPKKGWAAFWPDVQNLNPDECDLRYRHHAMDVEAGIKYGANIWVHQHDYTTASLWGCTGSFEG